MSDSDLVYVHLLRGNPLAGGATFGEVTEHMYARAGFIDELGKHEGMLALLEDWAVDAGLRDSQERAVMALEEVARSRGCVDRGELAPLLGRAEQALPVLGREAAGTVVEHEQRLRKMMGADRWRRRMEQDGRALAAHLGIDWPWVPLEARALFESRHYMRLWNLDTVRARYVPSAPWTPAPGSDSHFRPRPRESASERAVRFREWSEREATRLESLAPEPLPRGGTIPRKARTDRYRRWGAWYARHHLHGESIRQLATHIYDNEDRRKEVRNGIARAEEMLSRRPAT